MSSMYTSDTEKKAQIEQNNTPHKNIKHVIGVTSSKGGVGKSFIAGLLSIELAKRGHQVGLLDANFNGSSIPMLFGLHGPVEVGEYSFLPLKTTTGIKVISPNLLVDDETKTIVWKEASASNVIFQLYKEVEWGTLDYLLVDLPPATSELAVSIMDSLPFDGIVIVAQPQNLCSKLVTKAIRMVQETNTEIIGIVENMSYYLNSETNQKMFLFGNSHADSLSLDINTPILSRIPFKSEICHLCDLGKLEDVSLVESAELFESFKKALSEIKIKNTDSFNFETEQPNACEQDNSEFDQEIPDYSQVMTHNGKYFSDTVIQLIRDKDNVGTFDQPDAQGYFLGKCGDRMQIHLQLVRDRILNARFLADGCGATQACGSMITKMASSRTLEEAQQISPDELITALDGLPDDHLHCAELAVMTLREAVIDALEGHGKFKSIG